MELKKTTEERQVLTLCVRLGEMTFLLMLYPAILLFFTSSVRIEDLHENLPLPKH